MAVLVSFLLDIVPKVFYIVNKASKNMAKMKRTKLFKRNNANK